MGYELMDIITSPRHSRQSFLNRTRCARSLAQSLHDGGFAQESHLPAEPEPSKFLSVLANYLEHELGSTAQYDLVPTSERLNPQNLLAKIRHKTLRGAALKPLAIKTPLWGSQDRVRTTEPREKSHAQQTEAHFKRASSPRLNSHTEILPNGQRIESFHNGSMIVKDPLGRVIEVRSIYGDSLFLDYGSFGQLDAFTRLSGKGSTHSICKRDKHGVVVQDKDGRIRATGESMTIDPWGRFYLHNLGGQYFCLDLIGGIHSERRQVRQGDGRTDYITAVFAHDGFRMATLYATAEQGISKEQMPQKEQMTQGKRSVTYRFYGRDGTLLEFPNEDALKHRHPVRSLPPGTQTLNRAWLKHPQAQTAWDALHEYLLRQS